MIPRFFTLLLLPLFLGAWLGVPSVSARAYQPITLEELTAAADIIVNGLVEKVVETEERSVLGPGEGGPILPTRTSQATIKTLRCFKGEIPPHFEFQFPVVEDARVKISVIVNGPLLPRIQPGRRNCFYLRKKGAV